MASNRTSKHLECYAFLILTLAVVVTSSLVGCGSSTEPVSQQPSGLVVTPRCVLAGDMPADAWRCNSARTFECDTAGAELFVTARNGDCGIFSPSLGGANTFDRPGRYTLQVEARRNAGQPREPWCEATLTIVDTKPPVAEVRTPAPSLWPPNHKWKRITPADCIEVRDRCDPDVALSFTWASSDEVANGKGDGNTDVDIRFDGCGAVELRSERAGSGDGRVYTLGWRAEDASGNVTEGRCIVGVPHDQSGQSAVDSGAVYTINSPASC
jgi:hypothetical protein